MTITVKMGDAELRFAELVAKAEAGEEVVISRDDEPVVRLTKVRSTSKIAALIAEVRAARGGRPNTTIEEILAWRHEGHRY